MIMPPKIWIKSGRYFDLIDLESNKFEIDDIAHALANTCRFGGHCDTFYSVAQHSVLVSEEVQPRFRLAALMHDAAEAFIGDMPTPLKQMMPDFQALETSIEKLVFKRFGIPYPLDASVKAADLVLLATERRDVMPAAQIEDWAVLDGVRPRTQRITPQAPWQAKFFFLSRFRELTA